jgi:hypothetical protein
MIVMQPYEKTLGHGTCLRRVYRAPQEMAFDCHTFKVHEHTVFAPPRLALPNNHSRHHLLPQIWLPLLHRSHHHVSNGSSREPVEAPLHSLHGDHIEILGTRVVSAINHGAHRQTQRHTELVPGGTSPPCTPSNQHLNFSKSLHFTITPSQRPKLHKVPEKDTERYRTDAYRASTWLSAAKPRAAKQMAIEKDRSSRRRLRHNPLLPQTLNPNPKPLMNEIILPKQLLIHSTSVALNLSKYPTASNIVESRVGTSDSLFGQMPSITYFSDHFLQ